MVFLQRQALFRKRHEFPLQMRGFLGNCVIALGNCVIRFGSSLQNITFLKVVFFDYGIISFRPEKLRLQKMYWFVMVSESKIYYSGHVFGGLSENARFKKHSVFEEWLKSA